ncbi:MAG: hypothetical protein WAW17_13880, partial [Rhodococcus sp. (in: high G+C Gram-positive bacteria)]|uniref:hypothetical protein n=1 Tax=Rhodococcus sp. TaxID=1831 RepID=UPI003BAF0DB9
VRDLLAGSTSSRAGRSLMRRGRPFVNEAELRAIWMIVMAARAMSPTRPWAGASVSVDWCLWWRQLALRGHRKI